MKIKFVWSAVLLIMPVVLVFVFDPAHSKKLAEEK